MAKIFFCGDIINQFSDKQFISTELQNIIIKTDIAVCNFEGVVDHPSFPRNGMLQIATTPNIIKEAGFDICLLANNHITDYGREGLKHTLNQLVSNKMDFVGAGFSASTVYKPYIRQLNGQVIGIMNLCEAQIGQYVDDNSSFGYAWIGWPEIDELIRETRKHVDVFFLCIHAGLEHYELPLKEFRRLYRHYCDLGVDYVIGTHPHIAQGYELYKNSVVFYSLGNFYFPRSIAADYKEYENNSYSVVIDTEKNDFDLIYHRIENQIVELVHPDNSVIDIDRLNEMLGVKYDRLIRLQNDRVYEVLVSRLFNDALNGIDADISIYQKLKLFVQCVLKMNSFNNTSERRRHQGDLLKRLVENETYRFLTIDVLNHKKYE